MNHQLESRPNLDKTETGVALLCLIVALVSISLAAIFIRWSEQEISPYSTAFNRFWITTIVMVLWHQLSGTRQQEIEQKPQTNSIYTGWVLWQLLLVGVFLAADLMLWAWSLTQTSVANSTVLANFTPLFTSLGGWLFWGRRFDRRFAIGMSIAICGSIALGINDLQLAPGKLTGDLTALLAALCFGIYLLLLEQLQTRLNTLAIMLGSSAIATVLTLPFVLIAGERLFPYTWQGWLSVIFLAVICQVVGQGLLVYSLNRLSSGFVALFLMLDPVLAALGAWVFFSEGLTFSSLLAFAVILVGIYLALSGDSAVKEHPPLVQS
jgi:drug/metabolite transporter (DMT)-like permease